MNRIAERTVVETQNKRSKAQTKPMPKASMDQKVQKRPKASADQKVQKSPKASADQKVQKRPKASMDQKGQKRPKASMNQKVQKSPKASMNQKVQKSSKATEARRKTPPTTQELLKHIRKLQRIIKKQNRKILALAVINVTLLGALTAMLVVPRTVSKPEAAEEEEAVVLQQKSSAKESSEEESSEEESSEEESSEEVSDESSEEDTERYQYSEEDALFFDKVFHTECGDSCWPKKLKRLYAEVMDNNVQAYGIEDGLVWPKFEKAVAYNYVVSGDEEVTEEVLDSENRELARKVREGEFEERILPENFRCLLPAAGCFFRKDGSYYGSAEDFAQECGIEEYHVCGNTVFFPEYCWTDEVQAAMDRYNAGWAATVAAAVTAAAATD